MCKNKILKSETKNVISGIFRLRIEKTIAIFRISTLKYAEIQKIVQNNKNNFWTKNALYLSILGRKFENYCPIFSILEFVKMQSFVQNYKSLTLGPKMSDLGV